ncbi:MAG: DUF1207 domain-containing protein [Pirellulaceae bacterium]
MKQMFTNGVLLVAVLMLAVPTVVKSQDLVRWPMEQHANREQQAVYHQSILDPRQFPAEESLIEQASHFGYDEGLSQLDAPPPGAYGEYDFEPVPHGVGFEDYAEPKIYDWTFLPAESIYKPYMAGVKESRASVHLMKNTGDNWLLDGNLGGRFGVLRFGDDSGIMAEGFQWDVESAAHVRLDIQEEVDVRSVDFRAGTQVSWSYRENPRHRTRFGYYHISSHLGDEFLIKNSGYDRLNYARDVLILGHSYYFTPRFRVYGEMGWAFYNKESKPWEFQFGFEYAPYAATGPMGEPFFAVHGHLREDVRYSGNFVFQAGWAWVGEVPGRTLRTGLHYYNGKSSQYSFVNQFEQQIGYGLWYDF